MTPEHESARAARMGCRGTVLTVGSPRRLDASFHRRGRARRDPPRCSSSCSSGSISVAQPFPFGAERRCRSSRCAAPASSASCRGRPILVLVNRFARPVLVALTGRLLFSTMGFFVVIINAIAIYITSFIAPIKIGTSPTRRSCGSSSRPPCTPALSTLMDARPRPQSADLGADHSRGIWGFLESLPTPRRNVIIENLRLQQVYSAIYTTSLDIALEDTPIGAIRRWFARRGARRQGQPRQTRPGRSGSWHAPAARTDLREDRPDDGQPGGHPAGRTGSPSCRSSRARPPRSPTRTSSRSSPRSSGAPPEALYATFDPIPFAAASTAQVHQARLHDGTLVAVKVQRPRIQAKTQADLGRHPGAGRGRRAAVRGRPQGRAHGRSSREFAQGVLKELDYRNEAYHARRLADGMQRFPEIHVPTV